MTDNPMARFNADVKAGRFGRDPDALLAALDEMERRADEALRAYADIRDEAGDLTTEGFSADGAIRVVLDDAGKVTAVEIPESHLRHLSRLGGMVVDAIGRARAAHAMKTADVAARMAGSIDVGAMVRDALPEELRHAGGPERPRPRR